MQLIREKVFYLLIIPPPSLLNICISKERNTMPVKKVFFILFYARRMKVIQREKLLFQEFPFTETFQFNSSFKSLVVIER
jgi:hypothetical protein